MAARINAIYLINQEYLYSFVSGSMLASPVVLPRPSVWLGTAKPRPLWWVCGEVNAEATRQVCATKHSRVRRAARIGRAATE